ncbi:MAG: methylated-DNA--[protein]-cysteine S-methyltransferase [Kiritimatiellae bacterium]|nr:methylated-DNA--[protein]-cysteine S-methyltransferase [Kiritimatiellia bacterium]MCO6401813.1 methylated-DNA--[protein]-cysteine S-methyltransferase [Verrucomicrobiota bacterium]
MSEPKQSKLVLHTTWGPIVIVAQSGRIVSCDLPRCDRAPSEGPRILREEVPLSNRRDVAVLKQAARFVRAAIAGRAAPVPPALEDGAPFFLACRRAMQRIPLGGSVTYRELAANAGSPAAVRAAGQACARNPLCLFVPCHRVLAANGRLGGFSAGLAWKEYLLRVEARR